MVGTPGLSVRQSARAANAPGLTEGGLVQEVNTVRRVYEARQRPAQASVWHRLSMCVYTWLAASFGATYTSYSASR